MAVWLIGDLDEDDVAGMVDAAVVARPARDRWLPVFDEEVAVGDVVLLPVDGGETLVVGWVVGHPFTSDEPPEGFPHRRLTKFLGRISRDRLGRGELGRERLLGTRALARLATVDHRRLLDRLRP